MDYLKRAMIMKDEIIQNRRYLHQHPEVGLHIPHTVSYVMEKLREMGYEPQQCGEGIVALAGKEGKTVLLRADMDALPLKEESGLAFASVNEGAAHCCGHDMHTAMLLGAAKMLKENEENLQGTVKLMFQPGEEGAGGCLNMLEHGVLENPKVDVAFGMHVNSLLPAQAIYLPQGAMTSASTLYTIRVKGHGGHGSRPHETVDPINVACHIHLALQEILARELFAGEQAVMTIGSIQGGSAFNIIPEVVEMKGTIRTYDTKITDMMKKRLEEISQQIALAFRAEAEVIYEKVYTVPLVCNDEVAQEAKNDINKMDIKIKAVNLRTKNGASEDFSFISQQVLSSYIVLGASVGKEAKYGQHHPKVVFQEESMPLGAAVYAQIATEWLKNH